MTIFDKIISGEIQSWVVWQDEAHIAFLTPFPNTPGFTVVIPKENVGDDIFELSEGEYHSLMDATRHVAAILKKALNVSRVALVFEGTGVAHVHAKLMPLYGSLASQTDVWSKDTDFTEEYRGWLNTCEGPRMDDDRLTELQTKIIEAQQ